MRKIYSMLILFLFLFAQSNALSSVERLPSMEWQRQSLEEKINNKVNGLLLSILKPDQYSVDVEIITNSPADPDFNKPLDAKNKGGKAAEAEAAELETEKVKEEKKRKNKQKKRKSNSLVKFNDVAPGDNVGDHVVFSKFGMEAPLIDDFNEFQPNGKILLTMENGNDKARLEEMKDKFSEKEKQYEEKIKTLQNEKQKAQGAVSPIEQMWKYNTTIDVFKNLREVNILVRLSEGLSNDVKQKIETYVRALKFNLGNIEPTFKFEYSLLGNDLNQPTQFDKIKEWLDYASKYAFLFGVIAGTILLGFIGNGLIKKYFELNQGVSNSGNFKMDSQSNDDNEAEDAVGAGGGLAGAESGVFSLNGVERFKYYIKNTPKDAVLLIKKWIRENDKNSKSALRALVQQMDNDILKTVFSSLSEEERSSWRGLLDKPLASTELARANDFISNQIVQSVIVPELIDDPETYDLILKLTPEQVALMVEQKPEISAVLMNALSLTFVSEVLSSCKESQRENIINMSVNISPSDVIKNQDALKQTLSEYVDVKESKPFVQKILKLVSVSTPELEGTLFKAIANNVNADVLLETARNNFPAELISELPVPFLKSILSSYPLDKKIKMLLSIDDELQGTFVNIFAPEGSKANDLVSVEFESYERDERRMEEIQDNKAQNWHDFVLYTRKEIQSDKVYSKEISDLLHDWSDNFSKGDSHLQAVA